MLEAIRRFLAELHPGVPRIRPVTLDSSLDRDLGLDSLSRVELAVHLERTFGVRVPEKALGEAVTVRDLLSALRESSGESAEAGQGVIPASWSEPVQSFPEHAATLVEVLDWHVQAHPDRVQVVHLDEGDETGMTYADLKRQSDLIAGALQRMGLERGRTVAIMLPTCPGYFPTYLGVLRAGGIPVPIYPPAHLSQIEDHVRRHAGILSNADAAILVTVPEARGVARLLEARVAGLRRVVTVDELLEEDGEPQAVALGRDDIAFIQYTSGSTGDPKGVVLTHANLLANIRAIGQVIGIRPDDVFVSWLPLYHDMGLIAAWLSSLYLATPLVVMSPLAFLARPERWLQAIHRYRGTVTAAPNFAYELCVKRIDDARIEGVDLGSLRLAANGAEPVIPETMRRFSERFASHGFRPGAMTPVYGLAEGTVGLLVPPLGRGPRIDRVRREPFTSDGRAEPAADDDAAALRFVSCGRPLPGHEVRIVDAIGREETEERIEGRLEFRGPSATQGYFRNAGRDAAPVRRRLARHRRPRLRGRRGGVPHRPGQGHRDPRRAQHLPAGSGGRGRVARGRAPRMRRGIRQPRSADRHRAPRGARRIAGNRCACAGGVAGADRRDHGGRAGRAAGRGGARAAAHGAEDLQRQDPSRRLPRAVRGGTRRGGPARGVVAGGAPGLRLAAPAGAANGGGERPLTLRPLRVAPVRGDRRPRLDPDCALPEPCAGVARETGWRRGRSWGSSASRSTCAGSSSFRAGRACSWRTTRAISTAWCSSRRLPVPFAFVAKRSLLDHAISRIYLRKPRRAVRGALRRPAKRRGCLPDGGPGVGRRVDGVLPRRHVQPHGGPRGLPARRLRGGGIGEGCRAARGHRGHARGAARGRVARAAGPGHA